MKKIIIFLDRLFKTNLIKKQTKLLADWKGANIDKFANVKPVTLERWKRERAELYQSVPLWMSTILFPSIVGPMFVRF